MRVTRGPVSLTVMHMKLYLAAEFTGHDWYPDYKKIKKILREKQIPFKIRKLMTERGLEHSIWAKEEYVEEARQLIEDYYSTDPKFIGRKLRVEKISKEFEETWFQSLIFVISNNVMKNPILSFVITTVILAMILFPFFQYD